MTRLRAGVWLILLLIFVAGQTSLCQSTNEYWQDIVLRIDDGPNLQRTFPLVKFLKEKQISQVIFYFIGRQIDPEKDGRINPQVANICASIIDADYEIGIHTFHHPLPKSPKPLSGNNATLHQHLKLIFKRAELSWPFLKSSIIGEHKSFSMIRNSLIPAGW